MSQLTAKERRTHYMADDWWSQRRRYYNFALLVAGVLAFVLYATVIESCPQLEIEITLFTIPFQALGYLLMMGLANVCYQLGPWSEQTLTPKDLGKYRRIAFRLGLWFSVLLPFTAPAYLAASCIFSRHAPKVFL